MAYHEGSERQEPRFSFFTKAIFGVVVVLLAVLVFFSSFKRVTIDAGHEGVMVDKPYIFGHEGMRKETIPTGARWIWRSTEVWEIDKRPIQFTEKFDDMISDDNIPVDFNAYLRVNILGVAKVIEKFGVEFYNKNVQEKFRTLVRNQCREYKMTDLLSDTKVAIAMQTAVTEGIKAHIKEIDLPINVIEVIVGKINPNEDVLQAINRTAAQQQLQKTELERARAELNRKQAEENRALADRAYMDKLGLSPEQFVRLESIKAGVTMTQIASKQGSTVILNPSAMPMVVPVK